MLGPILDDIHYHVYQIPEKLQPGAFTHTMPPNNGVVNIFLLRRDTSLLC